MIVLRNVLNKFQSGTYFCVCNYYHVHTITILPTYNFSCLYENYMSCTKAVTCLK